MSTRGRQKSSKENNYRRYNGQDNDTPTVVRDFKDIEFSLGRWFSSTRPDILIEGLRKYDPDGDEYAFSYAWIIIVRGISWSQARLESIKRLFTRKGEKGRRES